MSGWKGRRKRAKNAERKRMEGGRRKMGGLRRWRVARRMMEAVMGMKKPRRRMKDLRKRRSAVGRRKRRSAVGRKALASRRKMEVMMEALRKRVEVTLSRNGGGVEGGRG